MDGVILPKFVFDAMMGYLEGRPYNEVAPFMNIIHSEDFLKLQQELTRKKDGENCS